MKLNLLATVLDIMGKVVYYEAIDVSEQLCRTLKVDKVLTPGNYLATWTDGAASGSTVLVVTGD